MNSNVVNVIQRIAEIPSDKEVIEVPLRAVLTDTEYHSRARLNEEAVKRYMSVYKADSEEDAPKSDIPPLEVALINDVIVLFDGYHRFEAMKRLGIPSADVCVHLGRAYIELPYLGATVNLKHGVPMKTKDIRKKAFKAYIKAKDNMDGKRYKSYREIARDFANVYSYNTFRKWIKEDYPALFRVMSSEEYGEIEMTTIDPDMIHLSNAQDELNNIQKRYTSIKDEGIKRELLKECKDTLEALIANLPVNYRELEEDEEF